MTGEGSKLPSLAEVFGSTKGISAADRVSILAVLLQKDDSNQCSTKECVKERIHE